MWHRFTIFAVCSIVVIGIATIASPETGVATLIVLILSTVAVLLIRNFTDESGFLTKLFFAALLIRLAFGTLVHVFDLREFFGADARTYDILGNGLMESWFGIGSSTDLMVLRAKSVSTPGWGMFYLVAAIYSIVGRNILAAQSFCAVFGAAAAPLVYLCAEKIFSNKRVARFAAISIAIFPSFIIWSSQLMKDGLIIFLLVLAIVMVLQLQERFSVAAVIFLVLSLFGIVSLRFYMAAVAIAGSFIIGTANSVPAIARRAVVLVLMGVGLTYLGVLRNAGDEVSTYADLERIQLSRSDLAASANSGFGRDLDVSTTEGAIWAIPVGFVYLMFAPFPWEVGNLRQTITLPEVLLWWAMMPLMVVGIWYSVRQRLRKAFPILLFSLMLTLAYSIFSGNVGTAYRQRTQIQVFLFIFIAVGWELRRESREDRRTERMLKQRRVDDHLRAGARVQ